MNQVMLVDDYEIFRKQLKKQVDWNKQLNFIISREADNGWEALMALRQNPVDILVTDIKMPRLNGLELLERVQNEGLCKCVILLSEYADFEYARKGLVLGAFDYIVKPVENQSFLSVLSRAADYITKVSKAQKPKDKTAYERIAVVNCMLNGTDNFESAVSHLVQKCDESVKHDFIKNGVLLAEMERKIYQAVIEKNEWVALLVSDLEFICNKIIQSDNNYTIVAVFEEFLRELYTTIKTYHPSRMSALSQMVVDYILAHPFDKLTLTVISEKCFVSKAYLSHSFKTDMGRSYVEYVMGLKMQIVKKQLQETNMSMSEIAEKLHYEDYKYMGRLFKNIYGLTPSDYKKMRGKMQP